MARQESVYVGRAGGWHDFLGKRIRFMADVNGTRGLYVGSVRKVSATQALIKVSCEGENSKGNPTKTTFEFPTDTIVQGTVREVQPGEQP